jgi:hypothetical protein
VVSISCSWLAEVSRQMHASTAPLRCIAWMQHQGFQMYLLEATHVFTCTSGSNSTHTPAPHNMQPSSLGPQNAVRCSRKASNMFSSMQALQPYVMVTSCCVRANCDAISMPAPPPPLINPPPPHPWTQKPRMLTSPPLLLCTSAAAGFHHHIASTS